MTQPKVHIEDPKYTIKEVVDITGLPPAKIKELVFSGDVTADGSIYWPEVAKLVVYTRIIKHLPLYLLMGEGSTEALGKAIMRGPVPRAGSVHVKEDGSVYYLSTGLTSNHQGISVKWDGTLKNE